MSEDLKQFDRWITRPLLVGLAINILIWYAIVEKHAPKVQEEVAPKVYAW